MSTVCDVLLLPIHPGRMSRDNGSTQFLLHLVQQLFGSSSPQPLSSLISPVAWQATPSGSLGISAEPEQWSPAAGGSKLRRNPDIQRGPCLLLLPGQGQSKERISAGDMTGIPPQQPSGKCFLFPVTMASAPPATATSTNIRSSGSGSAILRGGATTPRPSKRMKSRSVFTSSCANPNRSLRSTSSYSCRMRSSNTRESRPARTASRMRAAGPWGVRSAEMRTLASRTTFMAAARALLP